MRTGPLTDRIVQARRVEDDERARVDKILNELLDSVMDTIEGSR